MSTEQTVNVIAFSFTITEVISLVIGVASILLGIFAIWLTLHLKKESEVLNQETRNLLIEIKTDAKAITHGIFSEMEKWGDVGRTALTSGTEDRRSGGVGSGSANPHNTNGTHAAMQTKGGKNV
ncbi:hypothetical protein QNE49_000332 [Vibrio fluvialis]|nr:hypothetical protein [Vibrio fluvialis]